MESPPSYRYGRRGRPILEKSLLPARNFQPTLKTISSLNLFNTEEDVETNQQSSPSWPSNKSSLDKFHLQLTPLRKDGEYGVQYKFSNDGPSTPSSMSATSSGHLYAEPHQTLVFLDWDDTLFPSTELFERVGLSHWQATLGTISFPPDVAAELAEWREAVRDYVSAVCALSDRCIILTSARRPWVETCVRQFAPDMLPMFDRKVGGPRVVYAGEALENKRNALAASQRSWTCCCPALWCLLIDGTDPEQAQDAEMTTAKLVAMHQEATDFYSRYPGQTWKNILSLGDMKYEHDAVQKLGAARGLVALSSRERLRTKAFVLPGGPSVIELTLRLKILRRLLPAYVQFDGDIDLNMRNAEQPMIAIALALDMPRLGEVSYPLQAWGRDDEDSQDYLSVENALAEVEEVVDDFLAQSW